MTAPDQPKATRPPLLIMGSPRSGTTFLSQMVNRFFDIHICRDNGTMLRFHRHLNRYEPLSDDANLRRLIRHLYGDHYFRTRLRDRGLDLSEDELLARVSERTYAGLVETVFLSIARAREKSSWGYKRASFASQASRMDDLFPGARYVHIIRDARDVVLSMRAAKDSLLERSWHYGALDWVSHIKAGQALGAALAPDRYLEVRYEHFMAAPADVLIQILRFSSGDNPDTSQRADRIAAEIDALVKPSNTEKWRRAVPVPALRQMERVAGGTLQSLGYPVVHSDVVDTPIPLVERGRLQADRWVNNLLLTEIRAQARYRFEVLKASVRARLRLQR